MGVAAGTVACVENSLFSHLKITMMDKKGCLMGQKDRRQMVNMA